MVFEEEDLSHMKDTELYFIEDEDDLKKDEQDSLLKDRFSEELPKPFIVVPGDEKEFNENELPIAIENEKTVVSSTLLNYNIKLAPRAELGIPPPVRRPLGSEPGVSQLTDHNYNNVVEHAYGDTLFYRRGEP